MAQLVEDRDGLVMIGMTRAKPERLRRNSRLHVGGSAPHQPHPRPDGRHFVRVSYLHLRRDHDLGN
jgi:hypothetical protein